MGKSSKGNPDVPEALNVFLALPSSVGSVRGYEWMPAQVQKRSVLGRVQAHPTRCTCQEPTAYFRLEVEEPEGFPGVCFVVACRGNTVSPALKLSPGDQVNVRGRVAYRTANDPTIYAEEISTLGEKP